MKKTDHSRAGTSEPGAWSTGLGHGGEGSGKAELEMQVNAPGDDAVVVEIRRHYTSLCARIDASFALLMMVQWAASIAAALWISPRTWAGDSSYLHPHVSLAIFYGGVISLAPVVMARIAPGERITRLTIAVTQMLMSSLLIHLTGGRIETHFHIFGSLAFLAFYLDWEVLVVASLTIGIDHFLRGMFLPYSIFGSYQVQPWRWVEHVAWVVYCDVFLIYAGMSRYKNLCDLTSRNLERERLLQQARYDSLTGLPNRSFLSETIAESMQSGTAENRGFACLYIDLDRFKEVNERVGHLAGDTLLRVAAERWKRTLQEDAFLAHIGGDKFIVLLPERAVDDAVAGPEGAGLQTAGAGRAGRAEPAMTAAMRRTNLVQTAGMILDSLAAPFEVDGTQVALSASIGISFFPLHGEDAAELMAKSDKAMYRVKHGGRNDFLLYSADLFVDAGAREEAEAHLRRAIACGELSLHYQPIFHATGPIAGCEALLRWADPVRGNIPPSHFIPLAEETGLIVQLGQYVLEESCRQAAAWESLGLQWGRIAVNVSSLELVREDFADHVIKTVIDHGIRPSFIEVEVTESALVNDFALAERHLCELRQFGIKTSIDDFGTGYSSLGRLRQLTLDTLKIDRSFVEGVDTSEMVRTVASHIIAMAHSLGMKVVGEGVETAGQLDVLRSLGCDQVQGYLLGKPMNKQSMGALLLREQAALTGGILHRDKIACR